ncbi:MAG: cytochrome b/b6 domain-containing protein [Lentimicrobium sp.]|nr:cytochrome b/b6 domain-containing protein [Lentimicrobium sp.]
MNKQKKVYVYQGFERFWHWNQALLIFLLAFTGFEIHSSYEFFGFETAVDIHNKAAWGFIILIVFAIFWHFTTGEWKQYIPTTKNLRAQAEFYLFGIFKNAPHPTKKTLISKLNPLQRLVYLGLKILVIPVMVFSGLLFMFYRYPQGDQIAAINIDNLEIIALVHTAGAFVLLSFVAVHLYLITTGHTITSNLKAMITGWEELEDEDEDNGNTTNSEEKEGKS